MKLDIPPIDVFRPDGGNQFSHRADPIGVCKFCLQLFRTFGILNVGSRTVPFHDLSSLVPQRNGATQKPPILPVGAADAHLLLERLTTGKACAQSSYNSIPIFRMNSNCPDSLRFFQLPASKA